MDIWEGTDLSVKFAIAAIGYMRQRSNPLYKHTPNHTVCVLYVKRRFRTKHQSHVFAVVRQCKLRLHIGKKLLGRGYGTTIPCHILPPTPQYRLKVYFAMLDCIRQVKQVSPLLALIERAKLCAEQFLKIVCLYGCTAAEPCIFNGERTADISHLRKMLVSINLYLETHGLHRRDLGLIPEPHSETKSPKIEALARKPGQRLHCISFGFPQRLQFQRKVLYHNLA